MTQVYLVPGFFGFSELGSYNYFHRVSETLERALGERGVHADVVETDTVPTGSIRRRAIGLMRRVRDRGGLDHDSLHFVGHSTGGLDVRMLLTPGVRLLPGVEEHELAARTRSAISLSTPHHGTPMANFFTSVNGRNLLYLLTLLATSGPGRYTLYTGARLFRTYARVDRWIGQRDNILDSLAENILQNLRPARGGAVWEYLEHIAQDQGAMIQLTPEALDLFNAAVLDRKGVAYVSFVSSAPAPDPRLFLPGVHDFYRTFTHAVYALCYAITRRQHRRYPYPRPDLQTRHVLRSGLGRRVGPGTNDGIVPALSQVWGRTAGVVRADHLDVVGQFQQLNQGKVYATWLHSGSGFDEDRFRVLWGEIADEIVRAENGQGRPAGGAS